MSDEAQKGVETAKLVRSVVVDVECLRCNGKKRYPGGKYKDQGEVVPCELCNGRGTVHASIPLPMLYDLLMGNIRAHTEYAWVIERGDSEPSAPTYYTGGTDGWSQSHLDAMRFARKQDAEKAAYALRWPNCRIAEHGWG